MLADTPENSHIWSGGYQGRLQPTGRLPIDPWGTWDVQGKYFDRPDRGGGRGRACDRPAAALGGQLGLVGAIHPGSVAGRMDCSGQAELAAKGSGWSIAGPGPTASAVWDFEILALDIPGTPGIDGEASRGLQAAIGLNPLE